MAPVLSAPAGLEAEAMTPALALQAEPGREAIEPPRVARNFLALFGGQMATWTMTLVWTLVVPRVLGPAGFGVVTAAISLSGVFAIFLGLGTRTYLVREIVLHPERGPSLVGTAIVLRLALAPLVALAAYIFARLAHYHHEQALALYLAAAANVLVLLNEPVLAMFQAIERMKYLALGDVINKSAQSTFGIALTLAGLGAVGITGNMAVAAALVMGLSILWLRRFAHIELRTNLRALTKMARDSTPFWAIGVFLTLYLWIDTIMLSLMTNSRVVGWYGASTTILQTLMFIPNLMATTWLPRLVSAFKRSPAELYATARKPLELVLVISAPVAAACAMAGHTIAHVLYGRGYAHAAPVLVLLGLGVPATYLSITLTHVMIAAGRQKTFQWLMLAATAINPAINLVLIPAAQKRYHNGAIGAAAALLITELIVAAGAAVIVRPIFNRAVLRRGALAFAASAAMWVVAYVARPLGTPASLGAGALCLLTLTFVCRIPTAEELSFVRGASRNLARLLR